MSCEICDSSLCEKCEICMDCNMEIGCQECGYCVSCHDDDELCEVCCCVMGSCAPQGHCDQCKRCMDCAVNFCFNQLCNFCGITVIAEEICEDCGLCFDCRKLEKNTCCYQSEDGRLRCRFCKKFEKEVCKECHQCAECDENRELNEGLCHLHFERLTNKRMKTFKETIQNPKIQDPNILKKISTYLI